VRAAWKCSILVTILLGAGCSSPGGGRDPGVADTPPDATAGDGAVESDEGEEAAADPGADVAEDPAADPADDPTPDTAPDTAGDSPGEADASPPPVVELPEQVVAAAASSCPACVVLASETWDASTAPRFPSLADYTRTIEGRAWHFRPWIRFRMPHPGRLNRLYAYTTGAGAVSVALTTGFPGGHYPCLDEATGDDPWAVGATRRMTVTAEPGWRAIDLGGLDWTVPGYDEVLLLLGQEGDARIGLASPVPPGSGDYLVNGGLIADAPGDGLACFPSMSQFEDDAGAPQLWIARLEVETQGVAHAHWFEAASTVEYGGHAALGDADGDGDDDLLAGGRLFRNDGAGGFEDVTAAAGLAGAGGETLWGDFDNDGARDILAVAGGAGLFRNNGDGTFVEVTAASGISAPASLQGAAWLDYDRDGDLDFFVASYGTLADPEVGTRDYLFRNEGDGTFTDVTEAVHMPVKEGIGYHGRGVCVADHDGDGDPDIYLGNYRLNPNQLWENRGADGFKDVAATAGVAGTWFIGGAYGHTIGPSFGDLDGDGRWDIVVPNLAHPRFADWSDPTYLHFAKGDGTYTTTPAADRGIRFPTRCCSTRTTTARSTST